MGASFVQEVAEVEQGVSRSQELHEFLWERIECLLLWQELNKNGYRAGSPALQEDVSFDGPEWQWSKERCPPVLVDAILADIYCVSDHLSALISGAGCFDFQNLVSITKL